MPTIIVAGLGLQRIGAFRGFRIATDGWDVRVVNSRRKADDFESCFAEVEAALAERSDDEEGCHILAFHSKRDERDRLRTKVGQSVRFRWSNEDHALSFGNPMFNQILQRALEFETRWRETIRPRDLHSPLVLPEISFTSEAPFNEIWTRADRVRDDHELGQVRGLVQRFQDRYNVRVHDDDVRKARRAYVSDDSLAFIVPPPQQYHGHGSHIPWQRRSKFTYRIPTGFHFDVRHVDRQAFRLRGKEGLIPVSVYKNVDPYGHCWGGS